MLTSTAGPSPEAMFNLAQGLPDARLAAVLAGQDNAVPQFVAQAVLSDRQRTRQASAGMQAQSQMAQQPPSKREELLAQLMNNGGIAGQAPASVANMASGGIVAFEEGGSAKSATTRGLNEAYRNTGTLLPETTGYEGMSIADFIKAIAGEGAGAVSRGVNALNRLDERMKQASVYAALPSAPPVSAAYRDEGRNAPKPPPETKVPPPENKVPPDDYMRGREGFRASVAGAGGAPRPIDVGKYFPAVTGAPTMPAFSTENPYKDAAAKTAGDYVREIQALNKEFGVSENPQAAYEQELRAQQAGAAKAQSDARLWALFNAGITMAGAGGKNAIQNIALSTRQAAGQYQKDMQDLAKLEADRKKALNEIAVANNAIKRGQVESGLNKRDAAQEKVNEATLKIGEIGTRYEGVRGQQAASVFNTVTDANTAKAKTQAQADVSAQESASRITAARISADAAVSRGEITKDQRAAILSKMEKDKLTFAEAYEWAMGLSHPPTVPAALLKGIGGLGGAGGPEGYADSKVKQIGK